MLAKALRATRPAPAARFMAFAADDVTRAAAARAAETLGIGDPVVLSGTAAEARAKLAEIPTPELLVVDVSGIDDPLAAVVDLADVCDQGTRVIGLGDVNDIELYRALSDLGVHDYLLKPVSSDALAATLSRAEQPPAEPAETEQGIGRLIAVVGARGGVGASTVAVNTAWMLAHERGRKVALVDLDLYFGTCALALDLEPGRGFHEALENPGRIDGLFIERAMVRESDNLYVLGAEESFDNPFSFNPAALDLLLDSLRQDFACVVIDMPRFAARTQLANVTAPADVIVVSDPSLAGMRDTMRLTGFIKKSAPQLGVKVVVNRVGQAKVGELGKRDFEKGAETGIDYLIPYDAKPIAASTASGKPLPKAGKNSKVVAGLRKLSVDLSGTQAEATKVPFWRRKAKKAG